MIFLPEFDPILHSHNNLIIFEPVKRENNENIRLQTGTLQTLQQFQSIASRSSSLLETFFERVNTDDITYRESLNISN